MQPDRQKPAVDAVCIRVNLSIERDFTTRDVFPQLRLTNATTGTSTNSMHYVDKAVAEALIADGEAQYGAATTAGRRKTFTGFLNEVRAALQDARGRRGQLASVWPVCMEGGCGWRSEMWEGTKAQLAKLGIDVTTPWPGEPGVRGKSLRVHGAFIPMPPDAWGIYHRVKVDSVRDEEREASQESEAKRAREAGALLKAMRASKAEFVEDLVQWMRTSVRSIMDLSSKPSDHHGYMILDTEPVLLAFDAIVEALLETEICFDAVRHEQIAQGYRAVIAKNDPTFQRGLAALLAPNPALADLVEGGS